MKPLRFLISGFWLSLAALIIVIGLMFSAARLLLPEAGQYRAEVAAWVGEVLGQPVEIGALGASWHGLGPSVELRNLTVLDAAGRQAVLQCASARIDINILASLRERQFEPGLLTVRGLHLTMLRRADGSIGVAGLGDANQVGMDESGERQLERWLLRQERLAVEDSSMQWRDAAAEGKTVEFTAVNLQLRNLGDRHRLDGTVDLPESLGKRLQVAVDVRGDLFAPESWQGQAYGSGVAVRLGDWWGKQPRFGVAAVDGLVDFRAWSEWRNGVQQVEGDVQAHSLRIAREAEAPPQGDTTAATAGQVDLASLQGGFHWQRRDQGWIVDVDNFSVARQENPAPPAQLRVEYAEDKTSGRRVVQSAYSDLRAEDVAELLLAARSVPADFRERLVAMAPQGILHDGYLRYQSEPRQAPQFLLRTQFSGVAIHPVSPWPGLEDMTGTITTDGEQGTVTLAAEKAALDFADLFRAPLPVDALAGHIYWRRDQTVLRVLAPDLTARNEDVKLQVAARLDAPHDGGSPYLDLTATFGDGKGDHVSRYLPAKIMHPAAVAWLDKAVINGRVPGGTARIYGRLADFPFDNGQGLFDIRFDVTDGSLDYAAGWPRLEEIKTGIAFRGRSFEAIATSAKSLDSKVLRARATIPDLTAAPAVLTVEGTAQGPSADAVRYVTQSPLHSKLGAYLDNIEAGGQSRLQLSLNLPLAKQPAKIKGALRISDGSLLFRDVKIDLAHIDGTLNFTERGLSADGIHAALLGQAVTIGANTMSNPAGSETTFSVQGTADATDLAKHFAAPLAAYIDGSAPWRGALRIPPQSQGAAELQVESSLQGVAVNLPAPVGKTANEARPLLLQVPLPVKAEKPVHIRYGDIADVQLALRSGKSGVEAVRGEARFGGGAAVLPAHGGVRVTGTVPEFDEAQWSKILRPEIGSKPVAAASVVTQLDVQFGALKLPGGQFDKVQLRADRTENSWDADVNSEQLAGHVHLPDADDAPLLMNMERLYLPRFKKGGSELAADPRKMRPLDIAAKSFHYGDLDLGEFRLHAVRGPAGLTFDDIHTHSAQRDMKINGAWVLENDQPQSSFTAVYDGDDAGGTLTALGFAGIIQGGKAHTDWQLKWPGSPADFALAQATGSIGFKLKDGRLLDVEPGAGRILGLLSFQALPRRLLFDFSDLFQKGFVFDSLAGSFTVEKGNAFTDNLYMDGPAARIEARGRVGLVAEDYDQRVTVIPSVSAGLPMAGALAGGVATGAAMFLVEKLVKPGIDKITKVEYQVTGPWANPTVARVAAAGQNTKSDGKKN